MRKLIKERTKDTALEPYLRWILKRSRGIKIPFDNVKNEIYDRQAGEVISLILEEESTAIDVGCNKGDFLELFTQHAPKGHYYAFEPIPSMASSLKDRYPLVRVFNYALSDRSETSSFYIIRDAPALSGLNERAFLAPEKVREKIQVRTEPLDRLISADLKIRLIKIDVEGAEGLVIKGGLETIKRNRPYIIFEHGDLSSQAFGISSQDIYDMLVGECGLEISLLSNWLHQKPPLSQREFASGGDWYFIAYAN